MICVLCHDMHCPHFAHVDGLDYFRCRRCQLTFLDPAQLPDADAEQRHYDLHENDPNDPGYRAFLNRLAAPLCEQLTAGSEGLDFGCGPGPALARMLEERGHQMSVYDPLFAPHANALDRQYDFVTCTEVVEHFHQPEREFELLAGLVKPGGMLAIMTSLLHDGIDFQKWHYRRDPTHVCFYRQPTFIQVARHYRMSSCEVQGNSVIFLRR
ncbi:MAG: class I SAM-dependent methyltransferase [Alcanivoracaceae bacterium]|jgi:SAM-dependent methyltransferase|nr:class I SAM-dependent methyltransferase [Alcanivoracaceae bacterium]